MFQVLQLIEKDPPYTRITAKSQFKLLNLLKLIIQAKQKMKRNLVDAFQLIYIHVRELFLEKHMG